MVLQYTYIDEDQETPVMSLYKKAKVFKLCIGCVCACFVIIRKG